VNVSAKDAAGSAGKSHCRAQRALLYKLVSIFWSDRLQPGGQRHLEAGNCFRGDYILDGPIYWLCHSDARQVFDLPAAAPFFFLRVFDPNGQRPVLVNGLTASQRLAAHQSGRAIPVIRLRLKPAKSVKYVITVSPPTEVTCEPKKSGPVH